MEALDITQFKQYKLSKAIINSSINFSPVKVVFNTYISSIIEKERLTHLTLFYNEQEQTLLFKLAKHVEIHSIKLTPMGRQKKCYSACTSTLCKQFNLNYCEFYTGRYIAEDQGQNMWLIKLRKENV